MTAPTQVDVSFIAQFVAALRAGGGSLQADAIVDGLAIGLGMSSKEARTYLDGLAADFVYGVTDGRAIAYFPTL